MENPPCSQCRRTLRAALKRPHAAPCAPGLSASSRARAHAAPCEPALSNGELSATSTRAYTTDPRRGHIGALTSLPEELLYKALAHRGQGRPGPTVSPKPARLLALCSRRLIGIVHAAFLSCSRVRKTSVASADDHRTYRRLPEQ